MRFVHVRFIITQYLVTRITECRVLTRCMSVGYVVDHDQVDILCFDVSCLFHEY
jgi:hypothetical protein